MAAQHRAEVERTYEVDDTASVPVGDTGTRVGPVDTAAQRLEAVYFDTAGLDLLRRGITLRRRVGGDDEGWHVKVPRGPDEKTEVRRPLGRAVRSVPRKVADPVRAVVRDRPLVPVARITTDRRAYMVTRRGEPVATLCDDRVSAQRLVDRRHEQTWREWELELDDDQPPSLFASIEPLLFSAGARPAEDASKLHRVLLTNHGQGPPREPDREPENSPRALLHRRLREHVCVLHEQDAAIRAGSSRAVHRMRVAARRLRSALSTTTPLFQEAPDQLRGELRWLGQVLAPARDAQVVHSRLRSAMEAEPTDLVLGPARRRLDVEMGRERKDAVSSLAQALDSPRYYRLLDALDALLEDLPLSAAAEANARPVLGELVRRDARRLHRAVKGISHSAPDERDAALHEARKKARRLRYAAELAAPAAGRRAKKLARRAKAVQQALGTHQDTVVSRTRLRQLGAQSFLNGENGFTFGLLHGVERLRAEHAERDFHAAWARVPRPRRAARWVSKT